MDVNADTLREAASGLRFHPFTDESVIETKPFYLMRPNMTCDSLPLCHYLYRYFYHVNYYRDDEALMHIFSSDEGEIYGFLPYCIEEKLPYYFRLLETYFNHVLSLPLEIPGADEAGMKYLKNAGLLAHYEVTEAESYRDYLYDAESLRTLAGRKYAKKRNHIHKFLSLYEGRWSYRRLEYSDKDEVLSFLRRWMQKKVAQGREQGLDEMGRPFDAEPELEAEFRGIQDILGSEKLYPHIKIGGIFIDGVPEAFSIGDYQPFTRLAVIDVEKANEDIPGLYQMINQQFALHEYPEALIINREDDVGLSGLRKSKMSYYPMDFARKYILRQLDYLRS